MDEAMVTNIMMFDKTLHIDLEYIHVYPNEDGFGSSNYLIAETTVFVAIDAFRVRAVCKDVQSIELSFQEAARGTVGIITHPVDRKVFGDQAFPISLS